MKFTRKTVAPSGWITIRASQHVQVQASRIYGVFYDVASWGINEQVRMLSKSENDSIQFGFADRTRATVKLTIKPHGIVRIDVEHEALQTSHAADLRELFWSALLENIARRLLLEPMTVVSAPGKINLFFKVGKLHEDGYHDVASIYQAVELREEVVVEREAKWRVGVAGENLSVEHIGAVPTGEDNLVVIAAKAVAALAGVAKPMPVGFAIQKEVPVSGGMGGGSADAAAAIVAVNELWKTGLTTKQLMSVAAGIGADVPFALMGGTAVGTGRGEKLTPIEDVATLHWVLLPDALGLSTPVVYKRLDELRAARGEDPHAAPNPRVPKALIEALHAGDAAALAPLLQNDLQEAALSLRPDLIHLLQAAEDAGALASLVSGSGPTIALLASSEADAVAIANRMRILVPEAIATSGPALGAQLED